MTRIPRYIDDPPSFLFWDIDEIMIICVFIAVGIISNQLTPFLGGGLVISKVVSKLKQGKSEGYFLHALYWWGIFPIKEIPPSHKRSFTE